jgi:2'-5' RNA ligase
MLLRLFIAIEISSHVKSQIAHVISELKETHADVRWEQTDKLHITLKFLGDTNNVLLTPLSAALEECAKRFHPFSIAFKNLGCFPNRREPRVVWVGVEESGSTLQQLAEVVESSMAALGFERETRRFHAHVTIGRVKGNRNINDLLSRMESITFESQPTYVSEVVLIKSELKPSGSVYTTLRSFILS